MTTAFTFPGQGSQAPGMGKALADAFGAARDVFGEVDEALSQNLSKLMFEGPEGDLTLTENAQPALMAVSMAIVRVLEREGGFRLAERCSYVAGHSLGEYSALVAAGAFSLSDGAKLLKARGQAMQRAVLGYSRVQESSADQAAISFLDRIHKSGRGMIETFEKMSQQELLTDRMQDPYARSHPMSRDRMASLETRVEASPYKENVDTPDEIANFKMIQAKVRGFMDDPQTTLRRYPGNDNSEPARYARAVAYYRIPDFPSANREIDSLIAAHPDNPYFWELKGQIVAEQRDFAGAAAAFEKSVKLKPNAPLLQVNLGATLVALEDQKTMPKARDVLVDSLRRDNTNAFAWLQLSFAYAALGDEGMAALSMAEQRFNTGRYGDAIRFAMRAREMLPKGSREQSRADDIVVIAEGQAAKSGRNGRGGFTFEMNASPSDTPYKTR